MSEYRPHKQGLISANSAHTWSIKHKLNKTVWGKKKKKRFYFHVDSSSMQAFTQHGRKRRASIISSIRTFHVLNKLLPRIVMLHFTGTNIPFCRWHPFRQGSTASCVCIIGYFLTYSTNWNGLDQKGNCYDFRFLLSMAAQCQVNNQIWTQV